MKYSGTKRRNWNSVGGSGGAWNSRRLRSSSTTISSENAPANGRSRRTTLATKLSVNRAMPTCQARCFLRRELTGQEQQHDADEQRDDVAGHPEAERRDHGRDVEDAVRDERDAPRRRAGARRARSSSRSRAPGTTCDARRSVLRRRRGSRPAGGGTSNSASSQTGLGPQRREQDDLADRLDLGQEHRQPIDAHAHPAGRGHAVLEGADVVEIDVTGLGIAGRLGCGLVTEAGQLVDRVVQLAVGVGQLTSTDDQLEPLDQRRVGRGAAWPAATPHAGSRGRRSARSARARPSRRRAP